ncbi:MAG: thiol-disulfide oxidoreductase DCC family protein [Sciscionella sp.]
MEGTLIFDGGCGFCTRSRNLLRRLDRHGRIRITPYQQPGVTERTGLTREQLAAAVWWIGADGARYRGAAAVNHALSAALGTRLPVALYRLPIIRELQDWIYRLISTNRHRLPGAVPHCTSHPNACD